MHLILSNDEDPCAGWLRDRFVARGVEPVRWLTAELLARCRDWEHRIDREGARVAFTLPDGERVESGSVRGTINRLLVAPVSRLLLAAPADRSYVAQEWMAFFTSWIHALPDPILNRPTGQALSGEWRHRAHWTWLAARAGLPVRAFRQDGVPLRDGYRSDTSLLARGWRPHTFFVIAGRLVNDAPPPLRPGLIRLAAMARTSLLAIDFARNEGEWVFAGASPLPDLRPAGEAAIDALLAALRVGDHEP